MSEKETEGATYESPPAYRKLSATQASKGDDLGDVDGRRQSVALNIIENPLKVSLAVLIPL